MTPDEVQSVKQAVMDAMTQGGAQIADQIGQQVGQAVSQAISKFLQTTGAQTQAATTATSVGERVEDVGGGEAHERSLNNETGLLFANQKRTYDEYQHESLESIRRNRAYVDKVLADAQSHDNDTKKVALQALQNAVETANMVGKNAVSMQDKLNKQHTAHRDIATDNLWNPVQQGAGDTLTARAVSIDDASLKAIGAMVAAALADALKPKA